MPVEWERVAWTVGGALVAGAAVYVAFARVVSPAIVRAVKARNPRNQTLVNAVQVYTRAAGAGAGVVVVLAAGGYGYVLSESAIVVAAMTLAIGVAGQKVFENVVSGVFLVADRNFNVGDWVAWGDGIGGTVEVIGFRTTRVRTAANEIVTVPNGDLANRAVRAPYARGRFRTSVSVGVDRDADLEVVCEAATSAAAAVDGVAESPPPEALLSFGASAVTLTVHVWIREPTHAGVARVESRLTRAVRDALAAADVDGSATPEREGSGGDTDG